MISRQDLQDQEETAQQLWPETTKWVKSSQREAPVSIREARRRFYEPKRIGESELPLTYSQIEASIEESRAMLDWGDDWDGEGSPGYALATWLRAKSFIEQNAILLWQRIGYSIPAPQVQPGSYGSIDIHWKTKNHELLVNVPVDEQEPASFYGDDFARHSIKGSLNLSAKNDWLLMWLME